MKHVATISSSSRLLKRFVLLAAFTIASSQLLTRTSHAEALPKSLEIVSIEVWPDQIELTHRFDYRQVLLTGKTATGESVDVTRVAKLQAAGNLFKVSASGIVRPLSDGEGQLKISLAGQSATLAVRISGLKEKYEADFIRDVMPAMSKMGCTAGTCHGAAQGKAGFKLSLRGYDSLSDHRALTDDVAARRINRAAPDRSLILLKTSGQIPHVGGVLTRPGEPYYEVLRDWIAHGIRLDMNAVRVAKIDVYPKAPIVPLPGMKQQMAVLATYTDGSVRDVTSEAFVESGNIEVVEADDHGLVTMLRRGESPVLVRYEGAYAAATLTVMGDRSGFVWKQPQANNYIDTLVYEKLQRVKTSAGQLCTDAEFVRRIHLDLTGLPPTAEAVRKFLADTRESKVKRDELIDQLIGCDEFIEHWTNRWADMLLVNRKFLGPEGSAGFRKWIRDAVAANTPHDEFVRSIITASGSNKTNPPASYYKILRNPQDISENTTQLFLAVRFSCNKCHDHPFERWTQNQYYNMAAYFAQVGLKKDPASGKRKIGGSAVEGAKDLFEIVFDKDAGEVKHVSTGQVSPPQFPYQGVDKPDPKLSRREQLAAWITSKENQYFAKSYVNRLWGYMLGTGLIEPIDDIRAGNPPSNPVLLERLTNDFLDSDFDIRHVLRTICRSRTYQHSIISDQWNEDDTVNYSHALARRLPAEVLYDAIHKATGTQLRLPGVPAGYRAAQLPDAGIKVPFLDDFGKPARESSCECERTGGMQLGPIMKLVNGPTVFNAITDKNNAITRLLAEQEDDAKVVDELYMRFLGRPATAEEIKIGSDAMSYKDDSHDKAAAAMAAYEKTLVAKQAAWEKSLESVPSWTTLTPIELKSKAGATFTTNPDSSISVAGTLAKDTYTLVAETELRAITAVRLEALADPKLPAGGPGRAKNGNVVVNEFRLSAAPKTDASKSQAVGLQNASADFSQKDWAVAGAIDGNGASGWAVSPAFGKNHFAIFETKTDVGTGGPTRLTIAIDHQYPDGQHNLGKFRISVTSAARPVGHKTQPPALAAVLVVAPENRNDQQKAVLTNHFRFLDSHYKQLKAEVDRTAFEANHPRLIGAQDLAWALINSPAFLFNR